MKQFFTSCALGVAFVAAVVVTAPAAHAQSGAIDNFNLATGTAVQTTADLNVRETPSKTGAFIAVKPRGSRGVVIEGPIPADGYLWYKVNYEIGQSGWNVANWLARRSTTTITTGPSTAMINSFVANPVNPATATETVSLSWGTTGVNRCWLYNSANFSPVYDINPKTSSYVVMPAWKVGTTSVNRPQIVYTLNCLDVMATNTNSLLTKTVAITLASSTARVFATSTTKDNLAGLGLGLQSSVQTTDSLKTRATYGVYGAFLGIKPAGSRGVITQGPVFADGRNWYFVDYEVGVDGWNAADWLAKRLSTSTVTTYATATISSFKSDKTSVDATNTPVTLSWETVGTLRCSLTNSSDLSLPPLVDNAPAKGHMTVTPNWRTKGANSVSITYTLRCQDASASVKKLVEASTVVTYTGTVAASGRITAIGNAGLNNGGATPVISGVAYGTGLVGISLDRKGNKVYGSGSYDVINHQWSIMVSPALAPGHYNISLYANNATSSTPLDQRMYTVTSSTAITTTP